MCVCLLWVFMVLVVMLLGFAIEFVFVFLPICTGCWSSEYILTHLPAHTKQSSNSDEENLWKQLRQK